VMRRLGGQVAEPGLSSSVEAISRTISSPVQVVTTYDVALTETVTGQSVGSPFQGSGPEAALSEFDARLDASVFWEKNRRPQNAVGIPQIRPDIFAQEAGTFGAGITKTTADGGTFAFRNNTSYDGNNIPAQDIGNLQPSRLFASDWQTNFEASFSRPLLQGAGVQPHRGPHEL
jgi:hypothetical protein